MVFATLLGLSLSSYVALNTHSLKMANRSFYAAEAINIAEAGLEEAIWAFNEAQNGNTAAWTGWDTSDGVKATRTFADFTLGVNVTGSVKVYIDRFNPPTGGQPLVIAKAIVALPHGQAAVTRLLEMRLKRRSLYAAGIVAKNSVTFSGNSASVDSWNSDPDNAAATAPIAYSAGVRRDKGSVAAASVTSTISVGNADIWGTASVGGHSASAISVGSNGIVGSFGTASGTKNPANIATDFIANMDPVTAPTGGTILTSVGATLGTAGTTTTWRAPNIANSLTVQGDVTIVLTAGSGVDAIDLTGTEGITLAAGASLTIYTEGDVKLAGNGLLNPNHQPVSFQLWGTNTSPMGQSIQIAGNGALKGIVYAPNASVKINGNGDVMGAVVAKDVTLTGNAAFHYDEALANWGVNTPFGVVRWQELVTDADRNRYNTELSF